MDVLRIHAEVENVGLRDAEVLEQLPGRVLESWRARATFVGGETGNGLVEAGVRFFPIQQPDQVSAQCIGVLCHRRTRFLKSSESGMLPRKHADVQRDYGATGRQSPLTARPHRGRVSKWTVSSFAIWVAMPSLVAGRYIQVRAARSNC